MTATNAVQQKGILIDFVGDLRNEEADRSAGKPYYLVTAKGDVNALREAIKALQAQGNLDERADTFLKFLPEMKEGAKESTAYVEIPYKKALILQKFLVGWGSALHRTLVELSKSTNLDIDGDGEADDLSWLANINVDVSIQDYRKVQGSFWGTLWGAASAFDQTWTGTALGVTDEEWKLLENRDPGIVGRISHSVGQGVAEASKAIVKAAVAAIKEGLKGAGVDTGSIGNKITDAVEQIKKIALYTGVSLAVAALIWAVLRFALRRPPVTVNVEQQQLPAKTPKGRR